MRTCRNIRSSVIRNLFVLNGLVWIFFTTAPLVATQEQSSEPKKRDGQKQSAEPLDRWQGSSLGMTLVGFAPGHFVVEKVREGLAAEIAGILPDDKLSKVGEIDLEKVGKGDLKTYLQKLAPNSKIKITVRRDRTDSGDDSEDREETIELDLVTDSKAMLDGWIVAERMNSNRVINESLTERDELGKLDKLKKQILNSVKKAKTPRMAYEKINGWIDKLGVSHTAIIPEWGYARLTSQASGGIGLTLSRKRIDGTNKYFVIDMEPGGPAFISDLGMGDEVEQVNGIPLEQSARLILAGEEQHHQLFMISSEVDETIRLRIKKTSDGQPSEVKLKTDADLNANSASKASIRVITHKGKTYGYYRIWNLMSMKVDGYLSQALQDQFKDCDGLIIDMRGRGGSIPVVQRIERTLVTSKLPVVGIIDKHSRSAKEILAIRLKGTPNIRLIGQKTCGAVTAATFAKLPSGNALMFPVTSGKRLSRYTKNVILEGKGVKPDVPVDFDLPYLNGKAPLIDAAKLQLFKMLSQKTI